MNPPQVFNIDDLRGQARLLLIFAASTKSPAYEAQRRLLDVEQEAFEAHDLIEVSVLADGASTFGNQGMDADSANRLREQFGPENPDGFKVVLLGKDGTERKHWKDAPVQLEAVYGEIDHTSGSRPEPEEETLPLRETAAKPADL